MSGGDEATARRSAGPELHEKLRAAEQRGLRGEPVEALDDLARLLPGVGPNGLCAVAECAVLLAAWGASHTTARQLCIAALASTDDAATRGRLLLCRAKVGVGRERREDYTAALTECGAAGDIRGQALALAGLSCPKPDDEDSIVAAYHVRVAKDALRLALTSGDPEAVAVCAGNLAAGETYLGQPGALRRWRRAAEPLPAASTLRTAEALSLNYANWVLTALGYGEYDTARRALHEGRALARGIAWRRTFGALESLIEWRTGDIQAAVAAARKVSPAAAPVGPAGSASVGSASVGSASVGPAARASGIATVITVAAAFERERRPAVNGLSAAVAQVSQESDQLAAAAQAMQARIRAGRHEPHPHRGLVAALHAAIRRQRRFGWEDLAMALTELAPDTARATLPAVAELWSPARRGAAARHYTEGLLLGVAGHALLIRAAEEFLDLPEPLAAAAALHAAARTAPTSAAGNRLRSRALDLYTRLGADRSAAAVLRDRRLHRGGAGPRLPTSQRSLVNPGLTRREREVAELVRRRLTAQEISGELGLSVGTVRNHIARIREKFGGVTKRQLAGLLTDGAPKERAE